MSTQRVTVWRDDEEVTVVVEVGAEVPDRLRTLLRQVEQLLMDG